jgi:DNA-binding NtrC family response regulator
MGRKGKAGGVVLVVDDDATIRAVVCEALRDAGYRVATAATPEEAADALRHARVGLVLADPQLAEAGAPGGDRWAALEQIKALARGAPVVIFTAHGERDFADYAERGFAEVLTKPFDLDELLRVVRRRLPARGSGGAL